MIASEHVGCVRFGLLVLRLGFFVIGSGFVATSVGTAAATTQGLSPGFVRTNASPHAVRAGCTAAATKALVHQFVGDFNTGRVAQIDQLWAPAPRFQWYSTIGAGERLGRASKDRSTLIPYFRRRAREHERILITVLGAGYDSKRNDVGFGGKLTRRADDLRPTLVHGAHGPRPIQHPFKGEADCVSGHPLLIVWSM